MSLLSPDRLTLLLAPDAVQALHTRGWNPKLVALEHSTVQQAEPGDWSAHLSACAERIAKVAPRSVRVVLSDRIVRYLPLKWNPDIQSASEELALAQIEFEDTYGENSALDWCLAISHEKPGIHRLLSAMPRTLLDGLKQLCAQRQVRLVSVRPSLIAVMQGLRQQLGLQGWFVNQEDSRLTLLHWDRTGCRWVATARCEAGSVESVVTALRRESMLAGVSVEAGEAQMPVYLVNSTKPLSAIVQAQNLRLTVLGQTARTLERLRANASPPISEEVAFRQFGSLLLGAAL